MIVPGLSKQLSRMAQVGPRQVVVGLNEMEHTSSEQHGGLASLVSDLLREAESEVRCRVPVVEASVRVEEHGRHAGKIPGDLRSGSHLLARPDRQHPRGTVGRHKPAFDQAVTRDQAVRLEGQNSQDKSLLASGQVELLVCMPYLNRPEDSDLHGSFPLHDVRNSGRLRWLKSR